MKKTSIVVLLLLVAGMLTGCNRAKDEVLPDGTKLFGERTLKDGIRTAERKEFTDGTKEFDVTQLPDKTEKVGRIEPPNGEKLFDVTHLPDGTIKEARDEKPNGEKWFNVTGLPDGTVKVGRIESPDGKVQSDVTWLPGGTLQETAQGESSHTAAREDGDVCANGAKACEADAQIEWMHGDGHVMNYVCRDRETQHVLKIGLVRGSKFDVAKLHMFQDGSQRWGAGVFRDRKFSLSSDGSYVLQGERQFAAENADLTLSLRPITGGASYVVKAVTSGHPEDIMFSLEGSCGKEADKSGVFAVTP